MADDRQKRKEAWTASFEKVYPQVVPPGFPFGPSWEYPTILAHPLTARKCQAGSAGKAFQRLSYQKTRTGVSTSTISNSCSTSGMCIRMQPCEA
jgi:hypothetical protein